MPYPTEIQNELKKNTDELIHILACVEPMRILANAAEGMGDNSSFRLNVNSKGGARVHLRNPERGCVTTILRRLARAGYRQTSEPSTFDTFMCWTCGRIQVFANFSEDGPVCRRVKVGEEMVPIYEIQCDDDETKKEAK